jgi:hypothetical protein
LCPFENIYIKNPIDNKYIILYNGQSLLVVLKNMTFPPTSYTALRQPFNLTKLIDPTKKIILGFTKQKFIFKLFIYQTAPLIHTNICEDNAVLVLDYIDQKQILNEFEVDFDILISAQNYNHIWMDSRSLGFYRGVKKRFNDLYNFLLSSPSKLYRLMYPILEPGNFKFDNAIGSATNFLKEIWRQTPIEGFSDHYNLLKDNPQLTIGTGTEKEVSFTIAEDTIEQITSYCWDLSRTDPQYKENILQLQYQDGNPRPELISPEFFLFSMLVLNQMTMVVLLEEKERLYNLKKLVINYKILYVYIKDGEFYVVA